VTIIPPAAGVTSLTDCSRWPPYWSRSRGKNGLANIGEGEMTERTEIREPAYSRILSDDELRAVAGGTTFRVNAETDQSIIVDRYKKTLPGK